MSNYLKLEKHFLIYFPQKAASQHFMSERQGRQMNDRRIKDYIESVNGYAVRRAYSQEEAEALSQEILLAAVKAIVQAAE